MMNSNPPTVPLIVAGVILVLLVVGGIGYYATRPQSQQGTPQTNAPAVSTPGAIGSSRIAFQASNLDPLPKGHYEGWVIANGKKVSFGSFNVDNQKRLVTLTGQVVTEFRTNEKITNADAFAISIEPDGDTDPAPSPTLILFGKPEGNRATLAFGAGPGQTDFAKLSGRYILKTPTDDPEKNETAGVWFVDPTNAPTLTSSLNLPDAPAGWKYEGWVVPAGNKSHALSTGRFAKVNGPDESNRYSATKNPAPPFPGEDFLRNLPFGLSAPLALDDGKSLVVVSIEPDLEGVDPTGEGPSQLKPLVATIPTGAKDTFLYSLELKVESLPTGVASIQ